MVGHEAVKEIPTATVGDSKRTLRVCLSYTLTHRDKLVKELRNDLDVFTGTTAKILKLMLKSPVTS
ncbi:hypothetical protein KFK09_003640 [Dendrobium nobile]|uniref:Uncharacterized protein n=1 Tax=Dendrobium nobile TaxID=94219 RepID=A0A8T3C0T0_DENNO|nr:hypothetical protein KFK09_003640 [Dendrobium nobile]